MPPFGNGKIRRCAAHIAAMAMTPGNKLYRTYLRMRSGSSCWSGLSLESSRGSAHPVRPGGAAKGWGCIKWSSSLTSTAVGCVILLAFGYRAEGVSASNPRTALRVSWAVSYCVICDEPASWEVVAGGEELWDSFTRQRQGKPKSAFECFVTVGTRAPARPDSWWISACLIKAPMIRRLHPTSPKEPSRSVG